MDLNVFLFLVGMLIVHKYHITFFAFQPMTSNWQNIHKVHCCALHTLCTSSVNLLSSLFVNLKKKIFHETSGPFSYIIWVCSFQMCLMAPANQNDLKYNVGLKCRFCLLSRNWYIQRKSDIKKNSECWDLPTVYLHKNCQKTSYKCYYLSASQD